MKPFIPFFILHAFFYYFFRFPDPELEREVDGGPGRIREPDRHEPAARGRDGQAEKAAGGRAHRVGAVDPPAEEEAPGMSSLVEFV